MHNEQGDSDSRSWNKARSANVCDMSRSLLALCSGAPDLKPPTHTVGPTGADGPDLEQRRDWISQVAALYPGPGRASRTRHSKEATHSRRIQLDHTLLSRLSRSAQLGWSIDQGPAKLSWLTDHCPMSRYSDG